MASKVTYNGNGSDGGVIPVDTNTHNAGDTVTIQPTGSLTKSGATFAYWNTKADGSGVLHGWPQDGSFTMPASDVTLYAQWFISAGLKNGGATNHYRFSYDSALAAGGLEPGRTQVLMDAAEGDYNVIAGWFSGATPSGPAARNVYVTAMTGGAKNTGDIRLFPNTNDPRELRCYLVSEITESGAGERVAEILVVAVGGSGPIVFLAALFLLTVVFGQLISNTATALVVIPIAVSAAAQLDISARPVLMCVCIASAASFLTPVATPANMMVMGPAGYRFGDYWKLGLPMIGLFAVVAVGYVPLVWSF